MNIKNIQTFLNSTAGIIVMAIFLVAINIIASQLHLRTDLTEDKLYTLSEGSKNIISKIKTPVSIRYYWSRSSNDMPIHLKNYAKRVEDLLKEFQIASAGKIRIEKFDPQPDSDAEDAAALDGIDGQNLQSGEKIYLGLSVSCVDATLSLPFLSPNNEKSLEYDITRQIYRVINPAELTVGVITSFPVFGSPSPPMRMPSRQAPKPWVFIEELKKDHDVRQLEITVDSIPGDITILLVIHPQDLSDETLFAIDQFVLRGGKLITLVDSLSAMGAQFSQNQSMGRPSQSSSLEKLFRQWGVEFDTSKTVIDMQHQTDIGGQGGQRQRSPAILSLDGRSVNGDDIVSGSLENIIFAYSGVFTGGDPAEGLKKTVLVHTSKQSQLVDTFKAQLPVSSLAGDFSASDKEYALAIRLVGNFKTAFPNGSPSAEKSSSEKSPAEGSSTDDDESAGNSENDDDALKESNGKGAVILFGDADMIYDDFWVRKVNFFGQTLHQIFSENNNLLQNSIEQLSGDSSLISIRSRGVTNRPFLVVKEMQLEAEKKYKEEINKQEKELSEAQSKISELQRTKKDQNQRFILSSEQKKELEKFREKQVEVRKKLKSLRKQLKRDIVRLETKLKWYNIGIAPILVSLSGLAFAFVRRKRND